VVTIFDIKVKIIIKYVRDHTKNQDEKDN